jgi:hypothetical protein
VLAISDAIQAAIIGGVISGAVVLLGVFLAEWLARARDRHDRLRRATEVIVRKTPIALSYLLPDPVDERRVAWGSPGWEVCQDVTAALLEADLASRPLLTRRRKEVRDARDEISVRLGAAQIRWLEHGHVISIKQAVSVPIDDLKSAVFRREDRDELWERYLSEGLPVDPDVVAESEQAPSPPVAEA